MGEVKPNPIATALRHWPSERFPDEDYQQFWIRYFQNYDPETVADAIRALILESDPYLPTCERVLEILKGWAVVPFGHVAKTVAVPATPEQEAEMRSRWREACEGDTEVDALCDWLHREKPEQFAAIAREKLAEQPAEVRALASGKPLIRSRIIRREVAAHARAHGLVQGGLFQEAR